MVVYLIKCQVCGEQYNGSTLTKYCVTAKNYKSTHRNLGEERKPSDQVGNQKSFPEHYLQS